MRILIDARKLGHGGIGTYLSNLISELLESTESHLTLIATHSAELGEWEGRLEVIRDDARPYSLNELFLMPRRILWDRFDVFHEPHFTLPFRIPIPTVVTVHDLIHINQPEQWYYPLFAAPIIHSTLRRATEIIAVSEATAMELRTFARGIRGIEDKISVIPNSYDPKSKRPEAPEEFVAKRFNVSSRYFLSVCSLAKPHKGAPELLQGFRSFKQRTGKSAEDAKLVIAGQGAKSAQARFLGSDQTSTDIIFVERPNDEELRYLYAGAEALVVPSTAEGFCLPVLEAQSVKTPVICTPLPAVKNLLTPCDLMLSDFGSSAIAEGLHNFIQLSSVRKDLAFNYDTHLKRFSRSTVTGEILDTYYKAVEAGR